ncbi:Bug family tripartite tricarboxylate transporter substrate binding protein [Cupriavidus sp. SS-3]|uniref:Bug family tripartite tricarboxylate transporter substrate binding protein n=1 Tax=Cupriavidus sp. SS-3 TaxID=3109596 RepID=UPI002DB8D076|nr:tripartite tricarboxylate transporter substrate binding protein [Cupriavidus sp. SS-3]MEC3768784.1 tripartite tricarboxylate transporter substrate binding protein [Cupriavidus sp. SS-3]
MSDVLKPTGRRKWLRLAGAALLAGCPALLLPRTAAAEQWPTKPVKIVIALAAGSSGDILARILAQRLEGIWKQPVIVENKPGAGGVIGTEYVVNATDGHTILLGTQSSILPKFTTKNLKFDPMVDLVPVYKVINYQLVVAVNAETALKAKTMRDLVKLSKSSSDGLFFGGAGPTSIFDLTMGLLNKSLGMRYTKLDFNSVGAMNLAVIRNDAQFMMNTPSSMKAQMDAGNLKPLAAISTERYPNLPDVPTLSEAVGYKGYLPLLWAGVFVPKSTPSAVVARIARDLQTLSADKQFKDAVETRLTGTVVTSSPSAFSKQLTEEVGIWKGLFTEMNYQPD